MNANGVDFKTCYLSDSGVFIKNKGCFVFQELEHFAFWLVVDGVEYIPEKDTAKLVVDQLCSELVEPGALSRKHIRKCLNNAHNILKNAGNEISLKASLALVVTDYSEIIWVVSGNSRLYLIRDHQLLFRSRDQSVAQSLVETDIIDEDGMTTIADRDILTNYLGIEYGFSPYISKRFKLKDGDVLLLCSLGFWEKIRSEAFKQLIQTVKEPTELLSGLKEKFLSNEILNNYIVGLVTANQVISKKKSIKFEFNHVNLDKIKFDKSKFDKMKLVQDKLKFNQIKLDKRKFEINKFDQNKMVLILVLLLGASVIVTAGIMTKAKFANKEPQIMVQDSNRKNTSGYEQEGDLLAKEGNYADALARYDQVLMTLQTNPDQKTEATIRLKISIIQMLKEGDQFIEKQHYEIALNRYEAARNFDVPNYFQIQTENKIANVRQIVNQHQNDQPTSVVSEGQIRLTPGESKAQSDQQITAKKNSNNNTERAKHKVDQNELPKPIASQEKRATIHQSASVTKSSTASTKPKSVNTSSASSLTGKATPKPITDVAAERKPKPTSTSSTKNLVGKTTPRPGADGVTEDSKLSQAAMMMKKGNEMLSQQKYREAVRCYKKARKIYNKLKLTAKVAQLDEKIQETKSRMHNSFEGSH